MRLISFFIIHCSAVRPNQSSSAADIDRWHRARGFNSIGYHFVVRRDGSIETGRPMEKVGAHCLNRNAHSIGICYEGGLDANGKPADTRTPQQKEALRKLLQQLHEQFPKAIIAGHNMFNPMKACPCFDAMREYADLQPKGG